MLNVEQVRRNTGIQRSSLFPQVGGFADGTRTHTPPAFSASGAASTTPDLRGGRHASWEIDFFGRPRSLKRRGAPAIFRDRYARQAAEILLFSQVSDQYLALLAFDDAMQVTRRPRRARGLPYTS